MNEVMENTTIETPVEETVTEEVAKVVERVRPYQLRKLCADDIFPVCKIVRQIGIKEFKECFSKEAIESIVEIFMNGAKSKAEANEESNEEGKNENSEDNTLIVAGISMFPSVLDIVDVVLGNIPRCKEDLNKFLSSVSGMKELEIRNLSMADYAGMIVDIIKKEEFKDFFKVVSELFE